MQARAFLEIVRRRWVAILVVVVVCTGAVSALEYTTTPLYRANAKLYFAPTSGSTTADLSQGSAYVQNLVLTYATLATTPTVLTPVIAKLDLHETPSQLAGAISASVLPNTVIVTIQATDPSAAKAAMLANAVAQQVGVTVTDLAPKNSKNESAIIAQTIAQAQIPKSPATPKKKRNISAAFVGGLVLGIAYVMLLEFLATQVRRRRGLGPQVDAPLLGHVPLVGGFVDRPLRMVKRGQPQAGPGFQRLLEALEFALVDRAPRVVIVAGTLTYEDRSATSLGLAVASAEAGISTLLIDAKLRAPTVAAHLGRSNGPGLSSVLAGRASFEEVVIDRGAGLDVLLAGPKPPNPAYLLGSKSMEQLLRDMGKQYDLVIIDSAPVLLEEDTARIAPYAAGVVLVSPRRRFRLRHNDGDHVNWPTVREAVEATEQLTTVLGVVVPSGRGTPPAAVDRVSRPGEMGESGR
jgi:capsular exopolysaccharide synthesis family protein